jgi:hypothetical protein
LVTAEHLPVTAPDIKEDAEDGNHE